MLPKPRNVALFRALQLGDLLCAIPAFRALRLAWPAARITLVGLPWARDFVRRYPYFDDFAEFPGFPGLPERVPDLGRLPGFFAAMQAERFDLAIQMHGSGGLTNPLLAALGARWTAGFTTPDGWRPQAGDFIPWPEGLPEIRRLLALAIRLGVPPRGEALELPLLPEERSAFASLRAGLPVGAGGYACIHPGARLPSRRWPPERFAEVGDALAAAGLAIVLTGTAGEARLLAAVGAAMRAPAIDLGGRTGSLGILAALVGDARLVVCNDTGISHVAAAMGTPSVVISSGGDAERWRPLDRRRHRLLWHPASCRPCAFERCPGGHECAAGVSVAAVADEACRLLAEEREREHVAG